MNIEKIPQWNEEAERGLRDTLRDDGPELARQVNEGIAELYLIDGETYMLTRVDAVEGGPRELVVCCMQGRNVRQITPWIIDLAAANGIDSIRYHTQRPALQRMVAKFGFRELERVYRLELRAQQ